MASLKDCKNVARGRENHDDHLLAVHHPRSATRNRLPASRQQGANSQPHSSSFTSRCIRSKNTLSFPKKLFQILEEAEERGEEDIISFLPHGLSFAVHNVESFVEKVMPRYFRTSRFQSFVRQLHLYGFRRISEADGSFSYHHEDFRRDKKHLSGAVTKNKTPEVMHLLAAEADVRSQHDGEDGTKGSALQDGCRAHDATRHALSAPVSGREGTGNWRQDIGDKQALLNRQNGKRPHCAQAQLARGSTDGSTRERLDQQMSRRVQPQLGSYRLLPPSSYAQLQQGPGGASSCHDIVTAAAGAGVLLAAVNLASNNDPLDLLRFPSEAPASFPAIRFSSLTKAAIAAGVSPARILQRRLLLEQKVIAQEKRRAVLTLSALNETETTVRQEIPDLPVSFS